MGGLILVLNAGSSSIKAAVFDDALAEVARTSADGIGAAIPDHAAALAMVLDTLRRQGIAAASLRAAGHRIVHGGASFTAPARVTREVRSGIAQCSALAPLHNPHQLAAIDALAQLAPDLPQVACFDTAFHATIPDVARRYALPDRPETQGLRRYGFHGLSYASLVGALPEQTGKPLPARLLALHLGNGASLCAIREGRSVATTMGYSPQAGLTMGTRAGEIDSAAVLELARRVGIDAAERLLNRDSGLLGLSGLSADMRDLAQADTPKARFAIDHFCHHAARHAGSMVAAMGGLDALAFTGGIGENAVDIRDRIVNLLKWAGEVPVHVVAAHEEKHIARETCRVIGSHEL